MKKIALVVIAACTILSGCFETETEKHIKATVQSDWQKTETVPLNDLVTATGECRQNPSLKRCDQVQDQLNDIAVSFSSCLSQQHTTLCAAVVNTINLHPIKTLLPKAIAIEIPEYPFYIRLPTTLLNSLAHRYDYRRDVWLIWSKKWQSFILLVLSIVAAIIVVMVWWVDQIKIEKMRADKVREIDRRREIIEDQKRQEDAKALQRQVTHQSEIKSTIIELNAITQTPIAHEKRWAHS